MLTSLSKSITCIFICLYSVVLYSQSLGEFEIKLITGSILPHHQSIAFNVSEYQRGIEIQYKQQAHSRSVFDSLYHNPLFGIGYQCISLGNTEKLGYASHVFASLDINLISLASSRIGFEQNLGLSYAHSSLQKSPFNTALSSAINFYAGIDLYAQYSFLSHHSIRTGIELSHISNGKIKTPNLGLNSIAISLAYSYIPYLQSSTIKSKHIKWHTHSLYTSISGAYKSDDFLGTKKYPVATHLLEYQYRLSAKYGLLIGSNAFYDDTQFAFKRLPSTFWEHVNYLEYGFHGGFAAHYNNLSLYLCHGYYIKRIGKKPPYFSRVGIRYSFQPYFVNLSIKSHKTTADFLECGIGLYLYKSKK